MVEENSNSNSDWFGSVGKELVQQDNGDGGPWGSLGASLG